VLLDTHVLLWFLAGAPQVSTRLIRVLDSGVPVFFSPLSIAEAALKTRLGKITAPPGLALRLRDLGFQELPLTSAAATAIAQFPGLDHHDPLDRLLLAQALESALWFETADKTILALDLPEVRDAQA
jgi:PIN domain nuclease of toxin-antitoxin system